MLTTTAFETAHTHPLFIRKDDGTMEIPPVWIGYYSGLSFGAAQTDNGITVTVWLDEDGQIPLTAECSSTDGLMDTITMFDTCLGFIRDQKTMIEKGLNPEDLSMAFGHMIMLMDTGAKHAQGFQTHPDVSTREKFTKAFGIYSKARDILHTILSRTAKPEIRAAVLPKGIMTVLQ